MDDLGTPPSQVMTDTMRAPMTSVRWRILALLMAYAGMCHFNRISISVAGTEHIMEEFSIDETRMGMVYSAYLLSYTLCMIPGGWLIDRFGPKRALMLMGFGSAVLVPATGLTAFASATSILAVLCMIRALLGLVSAPIHPGAARAVSFWMPDQARCMANGQVTGAAVIGISSTYFVFGSLMDLVGWPSAFLVAGIATLLLTLVWTTYATDDPGQHPGVNARERMWIEGGSLARSVSSETREGLPRQLSGDSVARGETEGRIEGPAGFLSLLTNRSLVLLTVSYATVSYFQYLFFYWMQYYFDEVMKLDKADARLYATIPTLAMAVGMMSGGWSADRLRSHLGGWQGRSIVPISGMLASAILLILGILVGHPVWVVTCFALAMGALGLCEAPFWVAGIEIGGQRGGLSGSILNAGGNLGGILAPVITPLFSHYFGWRAGLGLASVLCIIGAALWWGIDLDKQRDSSGSELAMLASK